MQQLQIHVAEYKCFLSQEGMRRNLLLTAAPKEPAQLIKLAGFSLGARALESKMPNGSVLWILKLINFQKWKFPWRPSGPPPPQPPHVSDEKPAA